MEKLSFKRLCLCAFILFSAVLSGQAELPREFRGAWVATVGNIDWPSKKGLSTSAQKKEILALLDQMVELNLNAVIFQVRPSADAFYDSDLEPWSVYLSGKRNEAPRPFYDPLSFFIEQAHLRGMEFHAWINPYRAVINYKDFDASPLELTYQKPEWFIPYGDNKYFDPGNPEVRAFTLSVVRDILQNYDIDALHLDDYFYPYQRKGERFNDDWSYARFNDLPEGSTKADWRRHNVDLIVQQLYKEVKSIKPWVQFGISPFGVWRNAKEDKRGSNTSAGQTNYDHLYADVRKWIQEGWVDYIIPQAYWHIGHEQVDYVQLLNWWTQNSFGAELYMGMGSYKLGKDKYGGAWQDPKSNQIGLQLALNQDKAEVQGSAFFSARVLQENPMNLQQVLKQEHFKHPALPPKHNKLNRENPSPVEAINLEKKKGKFSSVQWQVTGEKEQKKAVKFLVYAFEHAERIDYDDPSHLLAITGAQQLQISNKALKGYEVLSVVPVNRQNEAGSPKKLLLN